jgi:penicillin-binding protein-related factor A (putative recombinase)
MKTKQWDTPNKMHFDSLHKTFNKQCNYISTGNVYSNVQTSSFIRASSQLECNGFKFDAGHLQDCDMKGFNAWLAYHQIKHIKELTDLHNGSILYKFFHMSKGVHIVHGHVLTDKHYNHLATFMLNESNKSCSVIAECKKYICN